MKNRHCNITTGLRRWYAYVSVQLPVSKIHRCLEFDLNIGSSTGIINLGFDFQLRFESGIIGVSLPLLDLSISYFPA